MKDYRKNSSKRRRGSDASTDYQPSKRPGRPAVCNNSDEVSDSGEDDGEYDGENDRLSYDTAPARYSPRPMLDYTQHSSADTSCTIESREGTHHEHQKPQQSEQTVKRAQKTNDMTSQFIALTPSPAAMPHFLSFGVSCDRNTVHGKMEMNPDRIQCSFCKEWFFNLGARNQHKKDLPFQCNDCGCCFNDVVKHAADKNHSRCFVQGCTYNQRFRYSFSNSEIQNHIDCHHA